MLDRERKGDAVGRGQLHLHPAWLQLVAPGGQLLYLHRLQYVLSDCFYTGGWGLRCRCGVRCGLGNGV